MLSYNSYHTGIASPGLGNTGYMLPANNAVGSVVDDKVSVTAFPLPDWSHAAYGRGRGAMTAGLAALSTNKHQIADDDLPRRRNGGSHV